jgi:hypothetical protein
MRSSGIATTARSRPSDPVQRVPRVTAEIAAIRERATAGLGPVWVAAGALVALTVAGRSYYFASPAERVRSPMHPWLRPSGYVGQSAGILAFLIFLFLWLYPLRRRYRWLAWTGAMSRWLDVHVAAALVMPLLAAVHAGWRFVGVIGLGFASLLIAWLSGVVGRYLYTRIPRGASGLELSADEIGAHRRRLMAEIAEASGLPVAEVGSLLRSDPTPCEGLGLIRTIRQMVVDDVARWGAARRLRRVWRQRRGGRAPDRRVLKQIMALAAREMSLTQQARMLQASQRIFRFWHVAHRPFAFAALIAVLVHVGVVVAMGATWFW